MTLHPLCELFPPLAGEEFDALIADIREHGLLEPITVMGDQVLDGRNRLRACEAANVEPRYVTFTSDDPAAFVLSKNLYRRHLPKGRAAAIVADAQDWSCAHPRGGTGANQHQSRSAMLPICDLSTVAGRARMAGVSVRMQSMADRVVREDRELADEVINGRISVPKAFELMKLRQKAAAVSAADTGADGSRADAERPQQGGASTVEPVAVPTVPGGSAVTKQDREAALIATAKAWREEVKALRIRAGRALVGQRKARQEVRHWRRVAGAAPRDGEAT